MAQPRAILQKSLFRLAMFGAVCAFCYLFVYAYKLDRKSAALRNSDNPVIEDSIGAPVIGGAIPNRLEIQNISSPAVADLMTEIIADVMSFNSENYDVRVAEARKYFTPGAYTQYTQFLESSQFLQSLQGQDLQSGAYVEMPPLLINGGVYNGSYKWLFEAPVTISFLPASASSYDDGAIKPINRRFTLRAQFARVQDPSDPDAVKIEIWQILPARG